jgi:hypothetical protein
LVGFCIGVHSGQQESHHLLCFLNVAI